jgi:hypothetical protein
MKISRVLVFVVLIFTFSFSAYTARFTRKSMPDFLNVSSWINSPPLTQKDLVGKVVLIHFWNYSSVESLRAIPFLREWHEKYTADGLIPVGIHVPVYDFESILSNVSTAAEKLKLIYPIAIDNDFAMWKAYNVQEMPAFYLIDAESRIRYSKVGEGNYDEVERKIVELLKETGADPTPIIPNEIPFPDLDQLEIATIKLGYRNVSHFGNQLKIEADAVQKFSLPAQLTPHTFYLQGLWRFRENQVEQVEEAGALSLRFKASSVYFTAGTKHDTAIPAEVLLDGKPLDKAIAGADIVIQNEKSYVFIKDYRSYELVLMPGKYEDHVLEIQFEDPGTEAYAFGFG